jgi:uncharacterized protein YpbB
MNFVRERLTSAFNWDNMVSRFLSLEPAHKNASDKSEMGKNKVWFENNVKSLLETLEPARKFRNQVHKICHVSNFDIDQVHERTQAAYGYFIGILEPVFRSNLKKIILLSRKKGTKQYIEDLQELDEHITERILQLKRARLLVENMYNGKTLTKENIWSDQIKNYKMAKAAILKNEIREENPTITDFNEEEVVANSSTSKKKKKSEKKSTYQKTLDLFDAGKSIAEIAEERKFNVSTIYSHLERLIKDEELDIEHVLDAEKLEHLKKTLGKEMEGNISEAKEKVGSNTSWEDLKLYRASLLM